MTAPTVIFLANHVLSLDDKQKVHFPVPSSFMIPLFLPSPSDTESHSAYLNE